MNPDPDTCQVVGVNFLSRWAICLTSRACTTGGRTYYLGFRGFLGARQVRS